MGTKVFRCCLLNKLACCRVENLGKPPGKAKSLSENMDSWLHEPSVSENVGLWMLSACGYWARRFGVPVPAITAAVSLCFIKQEEEGDLIRSRVQEEQQPAVTWPCTDRKLFFCSCPRLLYEGLMETHLSTLLGKREDTQEKGYILVPQVFLSPWWSCLLSPWTAGQVLKSAQPEEQLSSFLQLRKSFPCCLQLWWKEKPLSETELICQENTIYR